MSITSADLKCIAGELSKNNQEIYLRTSISKYYYAAFHFILEQLSLLLTDCSGKIFRSVHYLQHGYLQEILSRVSDTKSQLLGEYLRQFHKTRKRADYRLAETVTCRDLEFCIKNYNLALRCWDEIDKETLKTEIVIYLPYKPRLCCKS